MKIGVISDTHLSAPSKALADIMRGPFADVSMILHAGDMTRLSVLDAFFGVEVIAVSGNMDDDDVAFAFPPHRMLSVDGFKIGLIHGWGAREGLEERIMDRFEHADAIVYGHSHIPANHMKNGILMFNPGSFSGNRLKPPQSSVGILTTDHGLQGKIVGV